MKRLTGMDAMFLYAETPSNHMHVGATIVFDPSTASEPYSFDRVKEHVRSRLHLVPPFQQRLVHVPFNLNHPIWVRDPDMDLDYHFRRVAVPAPGGEREFSELAGDIIGRPLDRSRPLWEMWIVEGLEHGHIGVVAKMHHSTIDGVSGAELMVHLLDLEPNPKDVPAPPEEEPAEHVPSDLEMIGHAVVSIARRPVRVMRFVPSVVGSVIDVARRRRSDQSKASAAPLPFTAPRVPWGTSVTPHRIIASASISLDEVKQVKNAFGTTVNDVVLAITSGALRRYLEKRGELPDEPLVAVVPVSVHTEDSKGAPGNQVSGMFTSLATDVEDPAGRLMAIREATLGAKETHEAIGAKTLMDMTEFAPPNLFNLAARLMARMRVLERIPPILNVVVSNVPGPPFPLYFAGAKCVSLHPLGPIFDGAGLNITVLSYIDKIDFGFVACPEITPDLWDMAAAVNDSFEELKKAAAART